MINSPMDPSISLERQQMDAANVQPGQEEQAYMNKTGVNLDPRLLNMLQMHRAVRDALAMQQAQTPQTNVEQDLAQQASQTGIGQLPAGNIGEGPKFAGGGIVAFNGEDESLVTEEGYDPTDPSAQEAYSQIGRGLKAALWDSAPINWMLRGARKTDEGIAARRANAGKTPNEIARQEALRGSRQSPPKTVAESIADPLAGPVADAWQPMPNSPSGLGSLGGRRSSSITQGGSTAPTGEDEAVKEARKQAKEEADRVATVASQRLEKLKAAESTSGLTKAEQEEKDYLSKKITEYTARAKTDKWDALSKAGFGSIGTGRTFVQSLGNIGQEYVKGTSEAKKEREEGLDKAHMAQIKLNQAAALRSMGYEKEAMALEEDVRKSAMDLKKGIVTQLAGQEDRRSRERENALNRQTQLEAASIGAGSRDKTLENAMAQYHQMLRQYPPGSREVQQAKGIVDSLVRALPSTYVADQRDAAAAASRKLKVADLRNKDQAINMAIQMAVQPGISSVQKQAQMQLALSKARAIPGLEDITAEELIGSGGIAGGGGGSSVQSAADAIISRK